MLAAPRARRRQGAAVAVRAIVAAGAAAAAVVAGTIASPHSAFAADDPDEAPIVTIAAADADLSPGDALEVEVRIDNPTDQQLDAQTVDVVLASRPIATRFSLSRWLSGSGSAGGQTVIGTVEVPDVDAGGHESATLQVAAETLPLQAGATWGAYGLEASSADLDAGRSLVVWNEPADVQPTALALTTSIVAPDTQTGLLTPEQLEEETGPTGSLTAQLAAVDGHDVAVGIDPVIAASIAAAGDAAPEEAQAWLDAALALPGAFETPYSHSDVIAATRAGLPPTSPVGIPADDGTLLPLESIEHATGAPVVDATQATLDVQLVSGLASLGTTMVGTASLDEELESVTPDASASIDGTPVLAADDELQRLVTQAANAGPGAEQRDSISRVLALLAVVNREAPSTQRTLAAALPAGDQPGTQALLDALASAGWVVPTSIAAAAAIPAREATLADAEVTQAETDRAALASRIAATDASVAAFASIAADPSAIIASHRLSMLAASSTTRSGTDAAAAVTALEQATEAMLDSVVIVPGSHVQIVSDSASLPVTISNGLDQPVTLRLVAHPSNGTLRFDTPTIDVTVPALSQQRVSLPVQVLGSGSAVVTLTMQTTTGQQIGDSTVSRIDAQPTVEAILFWVVGVATVLLLVFGIWRSIRKRRRGQAHGDIDTAIEAADADDQPQQKAEG